MKHCQSTYLPNFIEFLTLIRQLITYLNQENNKICHSMRIQPNKTCRAIAQTTIRLIHK